MTNGRRGYSRSFARLAHLPLQSLQALDVVALAEAARLPPEAVKAWGWTEKKAPADGQLLFPWFTSACVECAQVFETDGKSSSAASVCGDCLLVGLAVAAQVPLH
jgi:hypothetical protein